MPRTLTLEQYGNLSDAVRELEADESIEFGRTFGTCLLFWLADRANLLEGRRTLQLDMYGIDLERFYGLSPKDQRCLINQNDQLAFYPLALASVILSGVKAASPPMIRRKLAIRELSKILEEAHIRSPDVQRTGEPISTGWSHLAQLAPSPTHP